LKKLAAPLVAVASLIALAVPAGATPAKPSKPYHRTTRCGTGHRWASVWIGKTVEVRNPCSQWLSIYWGDNAGQEYLVRPGTHAKGLSPLIPWLRAAPLSFYNLDMKGGAPCSNGGTPWSSTLVYSSKRLVPIPDC